MIRHYANRKASQTVVAKTQRRHFLKHQERLKNLIKSNSSTHSVVDRDVSSGNVPLAPGYTIDMDIDEPMENTSHNFQGIPRLNESNRIINSDPENADNVDSENDDFFLYCAEESDEDFDFDSECNDARDAYFYEESDSQSPVNDEFSDDDSAFKNELAQIFIQANIKHAQGDILLHFLRKHPCHNNLPLATKTLLKTPRQPFKSIKVDPGEYYHIGFEAQLIKKLLALPLSLIPDNLIMDLHTDGMSIHRSSKTQLWPIQFRLTNIVRDNPSILGVYMGQKKPANAVEFFKYFVDEYLTLKNCGGILFKNKRIPIYIRAFIGDAPARALILNHRGHNAKNPCSKCKVTGKSINRRMTFCSYSDEPRNDIDYLMKTDQTHHLPKNESALKSLGFNMVTRVPFEYMHLLCLGITKKFLSAIVDKKYEFEGLSRSDIAKVTARLAMIQLYTPSEFARRGRPLEDYVHYKATEFRLNLLYIGPLIFHKILHKDAYEHFLLLHSASRCILVSSPNEAQLEFAEAAFKAYVQTCEEIYGKSFLSYNIHCLLHVVEDVRMLGNANNYSAFPYEDNMTFFRKFLRKPHQLLQQLFRRLEEQNNYTQKKYEIPKIIPIRRHSDGPVMPEFQFINFLQYKSLKFEYFCLMSSNIRDNCVLLKDGRVCEVVNIIEFPSNCFKLIVRTFSSITNFYNIPYGICSSFVGIYLCCDLSNQIIALDLDNLLAKCFKMPFWKDDQLVEGKFVVSVLLSNI